MKYLSFCTWLISLRISSFKFLYVAADSRISYFLKGKYSIVCTIYTLLCLFIRWWVLGCIYIVAIVNNSTTSMGTQVWLSGPDFNTFAYIPRNRITDHIVVLLLMLYVPSILFSIVVAQIYILTHIRGFPYLHIFVNIKFIY